MPIQNKRKKGELKDKRELYETKFESVKRWRNGVVAETSGSSKTEEKHLNCLINFCEYIGMNPDEIINARIQDLTSPDPTIRNRFEDKVKDLARKLRTENGYYAAREAITSLKSFFLHNHVPLAIKSPRNKDPETYTPTREEIQKLYKVANPGWEKARISFTFQSAIRRGSIPHLKYKHIKKDFKAGTTPIHIHLNKEEVKGEYFGYDTFIGKQAAEDLRLSLELRRRGTRKIPPEVISDESPLFRKENTRIIKPCDETAFTSWFVSLSIRAGFQKRETITPHALRRATETILEESNVMAQNWMDHIMGHRPRGAQGKHYSKPGLEQLRAAYAKAEPYLTIASVHPATATAVSTAGTALNTLTRKDEKIEPKSLQELTEQEIKQLHEKNQQVQQSLDFYPKSTSMQTPSLSKNIPENSGQQNEPSSTKAILSQSDAKPPNENAHKSPGLLDFFKAASSPTLKKSNGQKFEVRIVRNKDELIRLLGDKWDFLGELSGGEYVARKREGGKNEG